MPTVLHKKCNFPETENAIVSLKGKFFFFFFFLHIEMYENRDLVVIITREEGFSRLNSCGFLPVTNLSKLQWNTTDGKTSIKNI